MDPALPTGAPIDPDEPITIATIVITMTNKGQINMNGPIDDKMLCYGLLEIAKEVVKTHNDNKAKIVRPAFQLPPMPGKKP
jgi:hypothetical protein